MAKRKDLEFHVDRADGSTRVYKSFAEASSFAIGIAVATGRAVNIDVIAYSKGAAKAWAGDDGVTEYMEDPEASVFYRIVVRAESQGRMA